MGAQRSRITFAAGDATTTPDQHGDFERVRADAIRFLRDRLREETVAQILDSLQHITKTQWATQRHFGFGMGVRNILRAEGFTASALGVASLDDVWAELFWEALSQRSSAR